VALQNEDLNFRLPCDVEKEMLWPSHTLPAKCVVCNSTYIRMIDQK